MTKQKPGAFALSVIASVGYIALLTFANTYVMGLIVDRIQASPVTPDEVFSVFGPYILALLIVNAVGQTLSKLQDYAVYKLEINGDYQLSRLCFDTLSNQSMTFHTGRFGGSLVSQTSRFVSGYSGLVDVLTYSLWPTLASVILTIAMLAPAAPTFVLILIAMLVIYIVYAYTMYRRILPLSSAASQAQNRLSGILSDAVTNILAVKTCGREDFERGLFDEADREAMDKENVNMHATMKRGFTTSALITIIMFVTSIFVSGGNAWFGISAGTLVMMFTYTYNLTMRFNYSHSVTVTNTGSAAGRSVVEVYAQTPYGDYEKKNQVEKPAVVLVGFAKTGELDPGASETVSVQVEQYLLASYDYTSAKGYILSAGTYYLAIGDDAHDALNNILAAKGATGMVAVDGTRTGGDASKTYSWDLSSVDANRYAMSRYVGGQQVTNCFDDANLNNLGKR